MNQEIEIKHLEVYLTKYKKHPVIEHKMCDPTTDE